MIKKIAQKILKASAKTAIKRNGYSIIAITGSVGKTSTQKAVSLVLGSKYSVLSSEREGYNTEIGVPLAIMRKTVPKNKMGWLFLIIESPFLALRKNNYDFCVLEMGADKPGDIEYLTNIARPDISIVTSVSKIHLSQGQFTGLNDIAKEKEKILIKLKSNGIAILNIDNKYIADMSVPKGTKRITFGKKSSEVKIIKQDLTNKGSLNYFEVMGRDIRISSKAIGEHVLYVFAAAISVGLSQKIELKNIINSLELFKPARGRLNVVDGVSQSIIIDDSYNANPVSMINALDILGKFKAKRKIALLGSMNELGLHEKEEHQKIGEYLYGKCDILVTVGESAGKYLAPAAIDAGILPDNVHVFKSSIQAGEFLKKDIAHGDVVLVKGSQNKIRLERAVKILMKNPGDASEVLCRQGREWNTRQ